ncbi:MAG TPA: hypothetical protein DEO88_16265 [Syntrophobacteraceae bacterium]|jgi:ABC-type uncharacterized transport system auxiliary subunit|nr:hypothetical protein [Syntrophobacteraceae bacterium]
MRLHHLQWRTIAAAVWVCLMVVLVDGCSSILSRPAPSALYQLDYRTQPGQCETCFSASVRIWPLEASPPYDQEALVVLVDDTRVRSSSQYSWVAQPGKMLSDWLTRDISQARLFTSVMTAGEHFAASYDLGGHLFVFAWQQHRERWRAVLEADITLVENRPGQERRIVLRKPYRLVGESIAENDAEAFARGMSQLVGDFSAAVQRDLCAVASGVQPIPAGSAKH